MAKQNDFKLQDLVQLLALFGPQAQQERAQASKTAQLSQIASALNIAGGVQSLSSAPKEQALRLRGAEADIVGKESATKAASARQPLEMDALQAQTEAQRRGGALSAEQLAQLQKMAPLQNELLTTQVAGAKADVAGRPLKEKREAESHQSDLDYRKTLGSAQSTGAMAQLLPQLQGLLALSQGTGTGKPGELVMTPEIRSGIMAKLMGVPELAAAFQGMQGQREDITRRAIEGVVPAPGMQPPVMPNKTKKEGGSWWESLGAFGIPSR